MQNEKVPKKIKPSYLVRRIKQVTSLIQNRSIYSVLSCDY